VDRILAGTAGNVDLLNYDSNGDLADAGGGNGTVAVTDSAGVAIAGSPFTATRQSVGLYRFQLPAAITTLDTYNAAWTMPDATTRASRFEVVGSFLYTVKQLQVFDTALANETTYPPSRVRDIREAVEDRFGTIAQVSFTRRGLREYLDGDGTPVLFATWPMVRRVVSLKIGGTTIDVANLKGYESGRLELTSGSFTWGRQNVEVLYEHGYDPPPAPVVEQGMVYGRELMVKGAFDDNARASSIQTELGLIRMTQATQGKVGIPSVDAVLADYGYTGALIG
jgi:hypothetical protein